jgi:hypothetical protein
MKPAALAAGFLLYREPRPLEEDPDCIWHHQKQLHWWTKYPGRRLRPEFASPVLSTRSYQNGQRAECPRP